MKTGKMKLIISISFSKGASREVSQYFLATYRGLPGTTKCNYIFVILYGMFTNAPIIKIVQRFLNYT